jgi:outer membrane protein OmpA-like peptidoglycan-associated protein
MKKSTVALKEIAKLFTIHPQKKYYIIVYCNYLGDFDLSIKLARKRADAVKNSFIQNYKIQSDQITAYGVVALLPVLTNPDYKDFKRRRQIAILEN